MGRPISRLAERVRRDEGRKHLGLQRAIRPELKARCIGFDRAARTQARKLERRQQLHRRDGNAKNRSQGPKRHRTPVAAQQRVNRPRKRVGRRR